MINSIKLALLGHFFVFTGYVVLAVSLFYLNFNKIYIIEQGVDSHWNYSLFYYFPFFVLYVLSILLTVRLVRFNPPSPVILPKIIRHGLLGFVAFVLVLGYVNIFLSGDPPVFSEWYISRHDYLPSTKLWPFLKIFGAVLIIIPISLGFLSLQAIIADDSRWGRVVNLLFILYLVYVVLIGQKFGAILMGVYFFLLPRLAHSGFRGGLAVKIKYVFYFFIGLFLVMLLVSYHYSKLSVAEEFGGAFYFILYRVAALQGHTFWGVVERLRDVPLEFWWDAMPNMMRLIGIAGVEDAIERGVNFTAGYPVILLLIFPLFFAFAIHLVFVVGFAFFVSMWLANIYRLIYVVISYFVVYIIAFFSHGNISYLLDYKIIVLVFVFLFVSVAGYSGKVLFPKLHFRSFGKVLQK